MRINAVKDITLLLVLKSDAEIEKLICDKCSIEFEVDFDNLRWIYCETCRCIHCLKCAEKLHKCEGCGKLFNVLYLLEIDGGVKRCCLTCYFDIKYNLSEK